MYVAIYMYLDIFFILKQLSQYLSDYAEHYEYMLKRLLQYVWLIINLKIMYELSESQDLLKYFNSDYASDKLDRIFILDYVFLFKRESVSWISQKQKSVIILIIKTEYIIMSMCAKTEVWLTQILRNMKLGKYLKVNLHCVSIQKNETYRKNTFLQLKRDNQAVLTLIKNAYVHKWLKHIDVIYHHI